MAFNHRSRYTGPNSATGTRDMNGLMSFLTHNWTLSLPLLIIIVILLSMELRNRGGGDSQLNAQQAIHFTNQKRSLIIDIRPATMFEQGHIVKAKQFDVEALKKNLTPLQKHQESPILIVCEAGITATSFARWLTSQNYKNVKVLRGGMRQWRKENLPVTSEK